MALPYELTGPIRTARLELRAFVLSDLAALCTFEGHPEVMRYLYWDDAGTSAIQERLDRRVASTRIAAEGDAVQFAVVRRDSGALIGHVMLQLVSERHRQGEIGYAFDPAHQGQGFAAEACRPVLAVAFEQVGLHRVYGQADARNTASIALMRRLGMRQEAHLVQNEFVKGEWTDEAVCAILSHEWAPGRP